MTPDLLSESAFGPSDESKWRAMAQKALKGADFERALVSHTDDGIRIEPVYPRSVDPMPIARG